METAQNIGTPTLWVGFVILILLMLAVDLGLFHRNKEKEDSLFSSFAWTVFWISLALVFNFWVYIEFGTEKALEFFTGYIIEKSLSVDNIFVFIVIFSYFGILPRYQRRVLFFGILGALVMRGLFIFLGAELLSRFHWVNYVFGLLLLLTGFKMLRGSDEKYDPENSKLLRFIKKFVPSDDRVRGELFFVRKEGRWLATPLFFVLVIVEFTDVVFAIDSIPAIFAITHDPFIVFTSNIFAILGLRSLFFLLSKALTKLIYLHYGLAFVLSFVGFKMLIAQHYKIPIVISLLIITSALTLTVFASIVKQRAEKKAAK